MVTHNEVIQGLETLPFRLLRPPPKHYTIVCLSVLALPGQWLPRESSSERCNDVQANWKDDASYYLMSGSSSFLTSAQVSSFLPWLEAGNVERSFFFLSSTDF